VIVLIFFFFAGCEKETPSKLKDPVPLKLPVKSSEIIALNNNFGIDLFRTTSIDEDMNKNLMLSPLSATTALTMLLNGCNSSTYEQIRDMLGFEGMTTGEINAVYNSLHEQLLGIDPEVILTLANSVWYRNNFQVHQAYLDTMEGAFSAEVGALDFGSPDALETINGWASENTNGKIPKVLNEIDPDAVMFLMNALYFKGTWTFEFEESQTHLASFNPENTPPVLVDVMRGDIYARTFSQTEYTAIEMTYGQQNFSMVVIVPTGSLSDFLPEFDPEMWAHLTARLDEIIEPTEYEVFIPKFKFEYEKYLNDQLKSLGMTDAFEPALADLSGIADIGLYVNFVKQNTFVDVNEEGTEAAAVTTVGIYETSIGPNVFIVDKPFIFAIRERTSNTLLFIGKVMLPDY
jgi:serpin B